MYVLCYMRICLLYIILRVKIIWRSNGFLKQFQKPIFPYFLNFKKLENEHVDFRITMSMTPPLLNMLDNELLQERYIKYLLNHIELAKKEIVRNADNPALKNLAQYYVDRYSNDLHMFRDVYECNLINAFKYFSRYYCVLEIYLWCNTRIFPYSIC